MSRFDRRSFLRAIGASAMGWSASGWLPALANEVAQDPQRRRHCVLLWMAGGPSQLDTFDMKPGHANGGEFKEIQTSVPGLKFSEHLPKLSQQAEQLALIRSLSTKEGDHGRGTYLMRTGQQPMGPIRHPAIGASLSKALGQDSDELPNYISIGPFRAINAGAFGPGFLGPKYAPLTVAARNQVAPQAAEQGFAQLRVDDLQAGVKRRQLDGRMRLWQTLQDRFVAQRSAAAVTAYETVYANALKLMNSKAAKAFDLSDEPAAVREAYGRGQFGQGCLMARRLIEQGVAFVEVTLSGGGLGWDTHQENFPRVRNLSEQLDAGWSTLMTELADRGLLDSTTILWMGEFGRTPTINPNAGRDHFPAAWSCVLAGGGIQGGQVYGKTSPDGTEVEQDKVDEGDVLATLCEALGVSAYEENITPLGRPIRIAEGDAISDLLA